MLARKISQRAFDQLYLSTLNDPVYRPRVDDRRHFRLTQLLVDKGYALDLSYLILRNRNFKYAELENINLNFVDLGGSLCSFANFRDASVIGLKADAQTKFFQAKLSANQLKHLQAEIGMQEVRAIQYAEVKVLG